MRTVLILVAALAIGWHIHEPTKISEKQLLGTWELVIEDLDRAKKKVCESKDKEDLDAGQRLGAAFERAISTFVVDLLDDFGVRFTFLENHDVKMEVAVLGERELEYLTWDLTDEGEVIIRNLNDDDEDEVWILKGDRLICKESKDKDHQDAYMRRVK